MRSIDFRESIAMAVSALKANKLRASLTLLGVVIGVFSFIGVMTGISVLQDSIESSFNVLGSNTLLIQKYPAIHGGPDSRQKYRNRKNITVDQGMYIRDNSRLAQYVNIQANTFGAVVQYRNRKTNPNVQILGCTPEIIHTQNREMQSGRVFSDAETDHGRNVVVLGADIVRMLFPTEDPLEKTVRVDGVPMRVIGVVEPKGGMFGGNADNFVLLPLSTFANHYGSARWVNIQAKAADQSSYDAMADEVIGLLRVVRRVPPGEENDFEVVSNESLISEVNNLTFLIRAGTGAISAIALLAAGIGIMNIMLVSVSERTREIGVRKAIGATRRTILTQFLIEAVVICQIGGLLGIALGLGGGNILALMLQIPPVLPIGWALVGLAVTSLIGVVFGVYPAWKASNLDPIEALRYE
ncbi:MAG: ABC transporter permease [Bacteroidota bacterium]|jgi:putative ABC transport system permease protein|nr:ABC transporter permease [Bacteroidota bacterium]